MAPENVPVDDSRSRLNALYETLDNILHPMPKRSLKRWHEEKFVLEPDFAPCLGILRGEDLPPLRVKSCIYFEKLNKEEQKAVQAALVQYVNDCSSVAVLPPKFCKNEKKCQGHHHIEDVVGDSIPEDLSFCYIYFF